MKEIKHMYVVFGKKENVKEEIYVHMLTKKDMIKKVLWQNKTLKTDFTEIMMFWQVKI